ncbi:MAG: hypothetical protein HY719_13670 [Planctomycetes bacterium]|nr:hypothetical protein [Planctomycetota bacterium]
MPDLADVKHEQQKQQDLFFGRLVVEEGLATREQVSESLQLQAMNMRKGKYFRLAIIMVKKGYITPEAAKRVLKTQNTAIVECGACRKKFNIINYEADKAYVCKHCGGPLTPANADDGDLAVAGTLDAAKDHIAADEADDATHVDLPRVPRPESEAPVGAEDLVIAPGDLAPAPAPAPAPGAAGDEAHGAAVESAPEPLVIGAADLSSDTSADVPVVADEPAPPAAATSPGVEEAARHEHLAAASAPPPAPPLDDEIDVVVEREEPTPPPLPTPIEHLGSAAARATPARGAPAPVEDFFPVGVEELADLRRDVPPPVPVAAAPAEVRHSPAPRTETPPSLDRPKFELVEYVTVDGRAVVTPATRAPDLTEPPADVEPAPAPAAVAGAEPARPRERPLVVDEAAEEEVLAAWGVFRRHAGSRPGAARAVDEAKAPEEETGLFEAAAAPGVAARGGGSREEVEIEADEEAPDAEGFAGAGEKRPREDDTSVDHPAVHAPAGAESAAAAAADVAEGESADLAPPEPEIDAEAEARGESRRDPSEDTSVDDRTSADGVPTNEMEEGEWSPRDLVGYQIGGALVQEYRYSHGICHEYHATHHLLDDAAVCLTIIPNTHAPERFFRDLSRRARELLDVKSASLQRVIDYGEDHGYFYLVKERPRGERLDQYVRRLGAADENIALLLFAGLLQALAEAHARGVFALHLPAQNVSLAPGGQVILSDFQVGDRPVRDEEAAARRDLLAAGRICYFLLTARAGPPRTDQELFDTLRTQSISIKTIDILSRIFFPEGASFASLKEALTAVKAPEDAVAVEEYVAEEFVPSQPPPAPAAAKVASPAVPPAPETALPLAPAAPVPVAVAPPPPLPVGAGIGAGGGEGGGGRAGRAGRLATALAGERRTVLASGGVFVTILAFLCLLAWAANNSARERERKNRRDAPDNGAAKAPAPVKPVAPPTPGPKTGPPHTPGSEESAAVASLEKQLREALAAREWTRASELAAKVRLLAEGKAREARLPAVTLRVETGRPMAPVVIPGVPGSPDDLFFAEADGVKVIANYPARDAPVTIQAGDDVHYQAQRRTVVVDGSQAVVTVRMPLVVDPGFYVFPMQPGRAPGEGVGWVEAALEVRAVTTNLGVFFLSGGRAVVEVQVGEDQNVHLVAIDRAARPALPIFRDLASDATEAQVRALFGRPDHPGDGPAWDVDTGEGWSVRLALLRRGGREYWTLGAVK